MDGRTIGLLSEYIAELHRRNRQDNGAIKQPSFDTTVENDAEWDERNRSRDERCGTDITGKGGNNLR
jgi:hypothetical protein